MPDDADYIADLRDVIIQQFMLHEVQHHALHAGDSRQDAPIVPVAHELIDIYKCLHQGVFGVGHIIDHPEGFAHRLHQEMAHNTASEAIREPVVESISVDGEMLRINLRPLRAAFIDDVDRAVDALAQVCLQSAQVTRGVKAHFFDALDAFMMLNRAGEIVLAGHIFAFPSKWVESFLFELRQLMRRISQVPVFSHSQRYNQLNRPSYRVVARSALEASLLATILER
ncbi:MAG: hypothetical protein PVG41_11535 [Desulfobacteraceae bacterium]|jgi:hypothetical protein